MSLTLMLVDGQGNVLAKQHGEQEAILSFRHEYQPGDQICLQSDQTDIDLEVQMEDSLLPSRVYLKENQFCFPIPFDQERKRYGQNAFGGLRHFCRVRLADPKTKTNYQLLSLNSADWRGNTALFPHAETNVNTTNPQFVAANAIDGILVTNNHGSWPHESWGINGQTDAWLQINFGRPVDIDRIDLFLRADFPHDSWWSQAEIECSNGDVLKVQLEQTGNRQSFVCNSRQVGWLRLQNLVLGTSKPGFPALSQIEVYGTQSGN